MKIAKYEADSEYICICGDLFYLDVVTEEEFCINKSCTYCVPDQIRKDSTPVDEHFNKKEAGFLLEMNAFGHDSFLSFLFDARDKILTDYFSLKPMDVNKFYAINELLVLSHESPFEGKIGDITKFEEFLTRFVEHSKEVNFLDDVKNKRYVFAGDRTLLLKYAKVFRRLLDDCGITTKSRIDSGDVFQNERIDTRHLPSSIDPSDPDLLKRFRPHWQLMNRIKYFLKINYRQSKIYSYDLTTRDIAFLCSIFFSSDKATPYVKPEAAVMTHLNMNGAPEKHQEFLDHLSLCKSHPPVFFLMKKGFRFGKYTLLFFGLYFIGLHSKLIVTEKQAVASDYENYLREELRTRGYFVPFDEEKELIKNSFKYDIIAISDATKEILLIEAKYRDFSPSSMNGTLILAQELEGKDGLIAFCDRQTERVEQVKNNLAIFGKLIGKDVTQYAIKGIVATKHLPIISQRENIFVMDATTLLQ